MGAAVTNEAVDLGIVVSDAERSLAFYRDLLGFEALPEWELPGGGGTMFPVRCGSTTIKLVQPGSPPAPGTGGFGQCGYRYCTIWVSNLAEIVEACAAAGHRVVVPVTEVRPGSSISIVEDPDGNWVEFATTAAG